jgi:4-amino-4-deoxy-L-arabinose transferase-like glycosyltransferase
MIVACAHKAARHRAQAKVQNHTIMQQSSAPIDTHSMHSENAGRSFGQRGQRVLLHPLVLVAAFTLLGLGLRLFRLGHRTYYDDEVISTLAARASLPTIYTSISDYSIHPPFYFMLLHFWGMLGGDDLVTLRLLSVLISTACVPLVYLLGRMLHIPARAALIAAAFFALSPFHIFHSQQARMYPLLVLLIIITTLLFYRVWRRGGWLSWLALLLSVGIGCHVHVYYPLSVAGLNAWALWESWHERRLERRQWVAILSAQALGVALFLPFVPQLIGTTSGVVSSFWLRPISPFYGVMALVGLSNFASARALEAFPLLMRAFGAMAAALLIVLVLLYHLRALRQQAAERSTHVLLHSMIWVPMVLATVISLTIKPILAERYLTGLTPFLFLLIAWTVLHFWHVRLMRVAAVLFALSIVLIIPVIYPHEPERSPLIDTARYLQAQQQPGDAIAYTDWQSFDATAMVAPGQPDVFLVPGSTVWTTPEEWRERMAFVGWHEPQNAQPVAEFAPDYERVWLVLTRYGFDVDYHQQASRGWLEEHGDLVKTMPYERGMIFLYEVEDRAAAPR